MSSKCKSNSLGNCSEENHCLSVVWSWNEKQVSENILLPELFSSKVAGLHLSIT